MKRNLSLLILLLLMEVLSAPVLAQLKTYLNLEAGPHWSLVKVDDPGNYFRNVAAGSTLEGFTLEQEFLPGLSLAGGIYFQQYKTGIHMMDKRRMQAQASSHKALMIPLRVRYRIQPEGYPFSLSPGLGYLYSINTLPEVLFSKEGVISATDGTAFSYLHAQSPEEPGKHLLEMGLNLGFNVSGLWQVSLNLSYVSGVLNRTSSLASLDYTDMQGNSFNARYSSGGDAIYTTLAFNVPVSNLWQNRDYRIRSRIEHSIYEGKAVERKGELYAGGELAALWRLFYSSDPALGARPMEGRGLFRHANLHTGIYAGYMFSHEVGIDLGVYYQRSSSFYALMFDHEVDLEVKAGAPMYLEIPLRFRYFYDIYKQKIFAVFYAGPSLLTQFSSGEYEVPGGEISYRDPLTQMSTSASVTATAERRSSIRPLLRVGVGAEYLLPIKLPMYLTAYLNYRQGFMAAEELRVSSSLASGETSGTLAYHGSAWSFDVGVKVPMSFDDRQNCVRLTK